MYKYSRRFYKYAARNRDFTRMEKNYTGMHLNHLFFCTFASCKTKTKKHRGICFSDLQTNTR